MTAKIFARLLGLFVIVLALYTVAGAIVLLVFVEHASGANLNAFGRDILVLALVALAVSIPMALFVSRRFSGPAQERRLPIERHSHQNGRTGCFRFHI